MSLHPQFLFDQGLKDLEHGGYFAITDASGQVAISSDKQLQDQVEATLYQAEHGDAAQLRFAHDGLMALYDGHNGGFHELADRYWTPHGSGRCRTLALQLDGLAALIAYQRRTPEDATNQALINAMLEQIGAIYARSTVAGVYSSDWSTPLELATSIELDISAAGLLATIGHEPLGFGLVGHLQVHAENLIARVAGSDSESVVDVALSRCAVRAQVSLVLARLANVRDDNALSNLARSFVQQTLALFRDPAYGGYWDRVCINGKVRCDWHTSYKKHESPFPIKTAYDVALLLQAIQALPAGVDEHDRASVTAALLEFHDAANGGLFMGKGYFWSTPDDPTVPFIRQFWAPPRQPGIFSIGNLTYLPLHLKSLKTQFAAARALQGIAPPACVHHHDDAALVARELTTIDGSGDVQNIHPTTGAPAINVDLQRYLTWLSKSRASSDTPYGLTAETAPLGFRADKTWQVFSGLHVISDLHALGLQIENKASLIDCIKSSQNTDGGFAEQPGHLSDVFASYCAVLSLRVLGAMPNDIEGCVRYLQACQNPDGGFGDVPGFASDIWHTNLAVLSLHALNAKAPDEQGVLAFALRCRTADGGFANKPGYPPDAFSVYRVVSTLFILNKRIVNPEQTVTWLQNLQLANGSFHYRPGKAVSLVGTYMAIAAMYLLDAQPTYLQESKDWIAAHQKQDGGFGPLNATSATTDESFVCIQTLLILEKGLSQHWVALLN
ncbi:prenyltransferase/squalene oxidase repeat-containing protein [Pseudomonas sp. 681]|uniref:Geranylgeranyl transferase type II subunit beta n=1 Tax=Pseudomonas fungipugnans TaxID=3024217 RepID=A0ABT6QRX2_9PSED|nr:prenyltransferase/squalene oxidase repeat-containing protein [Pseudomonas sp. 681]MDI2593651.1 prenyltransferase/squalene oxidase repeat-containing protein [Pseudomonas sp. 681]